MERLEIEIYKRYMSLVSFRGSMISSTRKVKFEEILECYDAFCFDGYGTLYNRGDFVYPMAREWFSAIRNAKKFVRLVTNAASNLDEVLAREACVRGFDFTAEETISSGSLLKSFMGRGDPLMGNAEKFWPRVDDKLVLETMYIGRPSGVNVLRECGITAVDNPRVPVVAVSSSTATEAMFSRAVEILRKPEAILLVLNSDAWAPNIDGSRSPVSGALSERLRLASFSDANGFLGCRTFYFGKPFPAIWNRVRQSLPENSRVLMIGDTLGTDVFGAYVAGFDSALVVGRNEPWADLEMDESVLGVRPTYYLEP